jgi:hypothetical protein
LDDEVSISEAERGSLRLPAEWEVGVFDQHPRGETRRLAPVEDGGGDVGGEVGEAENLTVVGSVQFLVLASSAKEICTFDLRGTETSNAYEGPGQLTERITDDFTKPQSSAAGVCFPVLGIGTIRTSQGDDFNFYN